MSESRKQNRMQLAAPDQATSTLRRLFAELLAKFALLLNLFRVLANAASGAGRTHESGTPRSPVGRIDKKTREQLALVIAESNLCAYCLSKQLNRLEPPMR